MLVLPSCHDASSLKSGRRHASRGCDASPVPLRQRQCVSPAGRRIVAFGPSPIGKPDARQLLGTEPSNAGWIRSSEVRLSRHNFHIDVRLSDFRITVSRGTTVILDAPIGVAKDNTPTPGGRYYTTELLKPPNPTTVYGTYAYGLSGFSEVLESFNGGPGQLGIHGTNDPTSIGKKVSSGCVRLRNEDIEALAAILPVGVPVQIIK